MRIAGAHSCLETINRDLRELKATVKSKRGRPRKDEPKSLVKKAAESADLVNGSLRVRLRAIPGLCGGR